MNGRIFFAGAMALALATGTILLPTLAEAANRPGGGSHGGGHRGYAGGIHRSGGGHGRYAGGMHRGGGYAHGGGWGGGYYGGGWGGPYAGGYYGGTCGIVPNVLGFCVPLPFGLRVRLCYVRLPAV